MKIKLPYENLEFLNTWPKSTLERFLGVFILIETELPNAYTTETIDITISDDQFINANIIDFSNTLTTWEEKIGLIHCNYIAKKKELGGYTEISLLTEDLDNFLKIGNALKRAVSENEIVKKNKNNSNIEEIICVEPKRDASKMKIVINNKYSDFISVDKTKESGSWNLLYTIAKDKEFYSPKNCKNNLDYFNTNKRNKIYTQTGLKLTKILKQEGEYVRAEDSIKIELIGETAFKRRETKQLKTT